MSTLMHLSIEPIGTGESIKDAVARVIAVIHKSGLPYEAGAMGTTVEGRWSECLKLLDECRSALTACDRLRIDAAFDVRENEESDRLHRQVQKVARGQ